MATVIAFPASLARPPLLPRARLGAGEIAMTARMLAAFALGERTADGAGAEIVRIEDRRRPAAPVRMAGPGAGGWSAPAAARGGAELIALAEPDEPARAGRDRLRPRPVAGEVIDLDSRRRARG